MSHNTVLQHNILGIYMFYNIIAVIFAPEFGDKITYGYDKKGSYCQ